MVLTASKLKFETCGDVLKHLGGIGPERVLMHPVPGKATEKDLLRVLKNSDRLFELVDGTLVEKVMGWLEASLAHRIGSRMSEFADEHDLGEGAGADATTRLMPGLVRVPDYSFVTLDRLPNGMLPVEPIAGLVPDLAVEVLSESNTRGEMRRKLKDYFRSGVRLVWIVDPVKRTVEIYTSPDQSETRTEKQTLDGGDVLPGLQIPLQPIFKRVPQMSKPRSSSRSRPRRGP